MLSQEQQGDNPLQLLLSHLLLCCVFACCLFCCALQSYPWISTARSLMDMRR